MCINYKNIRYLFFISILFLASCAPKIQGITEINIKDTHIYEEAKQRWEIMQENQLSLSPIIASGSLRFGYDGKTQRANFLLLANETSEVRIDIGTGFSTYANIYAESKLSNNLGVYFPSKKTLFVYNDIDYRNGFSVEDIEFPFSIHTLVDIIQGVFPFHYYENYVNLFREEGTNNFIYQLSVVSDAEFIVLDADAKPIKWAFSDWALEFTYKDSLKPSKIYAINSNANSLTIFINNLEEKEPLPESSFQLEIPNDTNILYEYSNNK